MGQSFQTFTKEHRLHRKGVDPRGVHMHGLHRLVVSDYPDCIIAQKPPLRSERISILVDKGAKNCLRNYAYAIYAYLKSAPKCIIFAQKKSKIFWEGGTAPLRLHPAARPHPLGACGASTPRRGNDAFGVIDPGL